MHKVKHSDTQSERRDKSSTTNKTEREGTMRKVTREAVSAFLSGKSGTFGNTESRAHQNRRALFLHGNCIALLGDERMGDEPGTIRVTLAGWPTPTTRERVNGLLSEFCYNHRGPLGFAQSHGKQRVWFAGPHGGTMVKDAGDTAWYTFNRRGELVDG